MDAFTDRVFGGNAACVALLDVARDAEWMQAFGSEMNQAATAFLHGGTLRWFSPSNELALCGHGTLATAHVLFERDATLTTVQLQTRSAGNLEARKVGRQIELDFPAAPSQPVNAPDGLLDALGAEARSVERSNLDYLVELGSQAEVEGLRPDFELLRGVEARGIIVTARADAATACDFVSRFFAPSVGIAEDAVTGSAHCTLGPYWASRLGRERLVGIQVSRRRGRVEVDIAPPDRVRLRGSAVTVSRGMLTAGDPAQDWYATQARQISGFADADLRSVEAPLVSVAGPRPVRA